MKLRITVEQAEPGGAAGGVSISARVGSGSFTPKTGDVYEVSGNTISISCYDGASAGAPGQADQGLGAGGTDVG